MPLVTKAKKALYKLYLCEKKEMTEGELKREIMLKRQDLELVRAERKKYESENKLRTSEGLLFDIEQAEKEAYYYQKLEKIGLKKEDLPILGWVFIVIIGIFVVAKKF